MADREHTLFLLDGMALVYRAHFAFATNPIRTAAGRNTSAIYGFTNTLLELLTKQSPTHLAVVFDTAAPTARHREFAAYKSQREEMPEELSAAIPGVKRLIRAFNLPALELDGYEADDIIGTLARAARAQAEKFVTYMVTPDKDFGQLVNDDVFIYRPGRMGEGAEVLGVPEVLAKWGIKRTEQVRDILGLWGDTSDNIPGVPGIGEKTAQKLIAQYDTLENVLGHAAEQKGKLRESLEKFRDQALLSKRLSTIDVHVPISFEPEKLRVGPRDDAALRALFTEFEFNSLGRRLFGESFKAGRGASVAAHERPALKTPPAKPGKSTFSASGGSSEHSEGSDRSSSAQNSPVPPTPAVLRTIDDVKPDYELILESVGSDHVCAVTALEKLSQSNVVSEIGMAIDFGSNGCLMGVAIASSPAHAFYFHWPGDDRELLKYTLGFFHKTTVIGHDLKRGLRAFFAMAGEEKLKPDQGDSSSSAQDRFLPPLHLKVFDTALAHAVVYPDLRHGLEFVAESLLNYTPIPAEPKTGQQDFLAAMEAPDANQLSARRAMERADLALQLHPILAPKLAESGQERVFYGIESPLLPVLAAMENDGIRLDPATLEEVGKKLRADLARLENSIYSHAGTAFNIGSPRQLGEILFGKLVLDRSAKKTKTGQYATDEATLAALAPLHPIVREVLEYREASKLLSTYVDVLPAAVTADGRIHTTFQQLATSTGRLNSQDPNLQNIPIRTAQGREIRRAFVPRNSDYTLLSADYSQIELRILAALTRDAGLLEALASGEDIHRATAARIFGLPPGEVTKEQRNQAKMVNYGISYGISTFGLSQRLGIPRADAKNLIEGYFAQYPGIRNYMNETVARARESGYAETITGRRRYLPDLRSANATVRAAAERNAINMPIQGSSADLIKIAMVQIAQVAREENWRTKLLLQVHDELVFDLHLSEKKRVLEVVQDRMKNALPELRVPIVVEAGLGANWLEAH
ncbi:MAG TPA: DNA polymerase I [Candidatus Methylacidiphilales bacterium]|nr:DNA polymerase I [Candidatus Methylacidiphilales bacterium]